MIAASTDTVFGGELHNAVRDALRAHWAYAIVTYDDARGTCLRVDVTDGDITYEAVGVFKGPSDITAAVTNHEAVYCGKLVSCFSQDDEGISPGVPASVINILRTGAAVRIFPSPTMKMATDEVRQAIGL